jgi:hypothetical protein
MVKLLRSLTGAVAVMLIGTSSSSAQTSGPALDADIETTYTVPTQTITTAGRYYRSQDGKTREDSPIGSIIMDVANGTVTLLNPATKEAKVILVPDRADPPPPASVAFTQFGETVIEGHTVKQSRATGASGEFQEVWTAEHLRLVMVTKIDSADFKMTKALRNVALREPNPALFQIPPDYQVIQNYVPATPPSPMPPASRAPRTPQ